MCLDDQVPITPPFQYLQDPSNVFVCIFRRSNFCSQTGAQVKFELNLKGQFDHVNAPYELLLFHTHFNNISFIVSWHQFLLVKETSAEVSTEIHQPAACHQQTLSH